MKEPVHKNKFRHACENCFFLGSYFYNNEWYDLYLHYKKGTHEFADDVTLIADKALYSGDYISGTIFSLIHLFIDRTKPLHPLSEALRLVHEKRWIHQDTLRIRIPDDDLELAKYLYRPHIPKEPE